MNTKSSISFWARTIVAVFVIVMLILPMTPAYAAGAVAPLDEWPTTPQMIATTGNLSGAFAISSGTNRLLVVLVSSYNSGGSGGQTFSATYGGKPLTGAFLENSNRLTTWIAYLKETDIADRAGDAVAVTVTGPHTNVVGYIASYSGVDQTTPITGANGVYIPNVNNRPIGGPLTVNAGGYGIYGWSGSSGVTRTSDTETYTEHSDYTAVGYNSGIASKAFASAFSSDPSVTWSANNRVSVSFVTLNPASTTATTLAVTAATGTYGGTVNLTAALSPAVADKLINFTLNGVPVGTATTNSSGIANIPAADLTGINVGTYPSGVGASFAGDGTHDASSGTASLTINPKALTITASDTSKTYGDTQTFAGTEFTTSALISGDSVDSVTLTSTGAVSTAAVGNYNIVPSAASGTGLSNYNITYANGTLTVNPKALTITASDASKTYGDTQTFAGTEFTTSALISGDSVDSVTLTSTGAVSTAAVGNYNIVPSAASGTGLSNYNITYANGTLTVNKARLTVTADIQTINTGDPDPVFTFSYSGFVSGDDGTVIDTPPTCNVPVAHNTPGTYDIVCTGGIDNNYNFTYVNGTLIVSAVNSPPTDISLSNSSVNENQPVGTVIGTLTTTDMDTGDTFTYAFCGGTDDASFSIEIGVLKTAATFDYETKNGYSICIRSTDNGALSTNKTFAITVNNLIDTATFADVSTNYWAWQYIESIYSAGITAGCGTSPLIYCPTAPVTRAQMAVFILRGIHGGAYTPPTPTGNIFADVPDSYWAAAWIEQLAAEGITAGCGGNNYCPDQAATRDQMAVFLLRAKHGSAYTPPTPTGTVFSDVPDTYWAASWIEQLAAEGITGGCGGTNYCPASTVTRDQMAVFLVKTFSLP